MKKLVITAILSAAFFLSGCEPLATFDKPQPADLEPLTTIPERLQGNYLAGDQTTVVTITEHAIVQLLDFDFKTSKSALDSSWRLEGDSLVNVTTGNRVPVQIAGDTIIQHEHSIDTLFSIAAGGVLKKFKGYYFLNNRYQDNAWEVKQLELRNGKLTVGVISNSDDLQKLKEISETAGDTVSTTFSPSRRQFKKFVRRKGFSSQETFTRIR